MSRNQRDSSRETQYARDLSSISIAVNTWRVGAHYVVKLLRLIFRSSSITNPHVNLSFVSCKLQVPQSGYRVGPTNVTRGSEKIRGQRGKEEHGTIESQYQTWIAFVLSSEWATQSLLYVPTNWPFDPRLSTFNLLIPATFPSCFSFRL